MKCSPTNAINGVKCFLVLQLKECIYDGYLLLAEGRVIGRALAAQ